MKNKKVIESDITFFEACEILKKSRKTISRYIRQGLLHPERIKSQRGTLEYRFKRADLENIKKPEGTG
jgi:predicted site-specific integrase-resolvase